MRSIFFVLLLIASFWVLYLGLRERPAPLAAPEHVHTAAPAATRNTQTAESAQSVRFDRASRGYAVFRARGCQTCHGTDATGSRMGPSLADARLQFDRKNLAQYLADPNAFIGENDRLLELQARYPRIEMPAYPDLSESDLEALMTFVLEPEVR
jgi:cytochrome c2